LKDREMKEKFYSLLIQKYERILCSDDANWLEKKLAIAEDQERNLDSFKQIRSESLILKERFSWLQKLKNLLLVCRMSYLTAKGNSKSHSFELFKALLDRTLSIAISVETPSFDFHRLQKIL
jgi:hypothetical protein